MKQFIENTKILFLYLPHYYKENYKRYIGRVKHTKFKAPTSPRQLMLFCGFFAAFFLILEKILFFSLFFLLFFYFYLYKIHVSGDPRVWYNAKKSLDEEK